MNFKEYTYQDMGFYYQQSKKDRLINCLTQDPVYLIAKYLRFLRKEEYFSKYKKSKLDTLRSLYYFRKKNVLGNKLGFKIPKNCFGPGLEIYHHGEIIVNEHAKIGANCKLHGGNCIGNNGINDIVPCIGDNLDLGIGAKIIGGVELGNNVRVGANAVVTKTFLEDNIILVGLPAHKK